MTGPDPAPDSPSSLSSPPSHDTGRLLAGLAWVALLLGAWLWGSGPGEVRQPPAAPVTGDMAAAGRPAATGR
ncbi:hypothetical protein STXM2123_178 [Streptomyces sp. F-3]|uniref:Class F sortase n=1 Tax=Streptomyces thermogriseus TaxID=75292 RepID=A0ABP4D9Z6_9ACTN|nr:hypothetical protein [Streptomyces sp. F-3]GAT79477.1 hypothetical protein STXM2123_178 [Streptomyces sp. F-3]